MNKNIFNFVIKMTILLGIIAITLIGLVMKLDVTEVASGDGILGMALMAMVARKEEK